MLRKTLLTAVILSLVVSLTSSTPATLRTSIAQGPEPAGSASPAANLLKNGDFGQGNFYWRPTNHYVADQWYEWQWNEGIPEFIDGGFGAHAGCLADPSNNYTTCHSQGYIRWGITFAAGIYQPVSGVQVCGTYRFVAYNRNDEFFYNPKVGIDVTGWKLPVNDWENNPPANCPPDGISKCPNPGVSNLSDFPSTLVWSPTFNHSYYWAPITVTAEALATTITVWTYAYPDQDKTVDSRSTYWDDTSLIQVPAESLLPTGVIPAPDGKLTGLTVTPASTSSLIQWSTNPAAFSQVYYRVHPTSGVTDTSGLTNTVYLPIIGRAQASVSEYPFKTTPTMAPLTNQAVTLTGLQSNTAYDYVAVSRWFNGAACVPSVSATGTFTTTP